MAAARNTRPSLFGRLASLGTIVAVALVAAWLLQFPVSFVDKDRQVTFILAAMPLLVTLMVLGSLAALYALDRFAKKALTDDEEVE